MKLNNNIFALSGCLALVLAVGIYVTFYQQPQEIQQLEDSLELAEMKQAEMQDLLSQYATSQEQAQEAVAKWNARYKTVPEQLTSAEVVGYLNDLSRRGFETFDVNTEGHGLEGEFSRYTVRVDGRGYFTSLYRFVWQLENNRPFYRIRDLNLSHIDIITHDEETGRDRMQVMVSFDMNIDAYYGGPEGMSAPELDTWEAVVDGDDLPEGQLDRSPPVPASVLADERPTINPFFPIVMDQLPPNTHGLVNMDQADLVSIADGKAIVRDSDGHHTLGVGDDVYLGEIVEIDPREGYVVARLNKGGIIDETRLNMNESDEYRRAIGSERFRPLDEN